MSNYQVLTSVEMASHTHERCRMWRLHSSDRQPVADRFQAVRASAGTAASSRGKSKALARAPSAATEASAQLCATRELERIASAARSERAAARAVARERANETSPRPAASLQSAVVPIRTEL